MKSLNEKHKAYQKGPRFTGLSMICVSQMILAMIFALHETIVSDTEQVRNLIKGTSSIGCHIVLFDSDTWQYNSPWKAVGSSLTKAMLFIKVFEWWCSRCFDMAE